MTNRNSTLILGSSKGIGFHLINSFNEQKLKRSQKGFYDFFGRGENNAAIKRLEQAQNYLKTGDQFQYIERDFGAFAPVPGKTDIVGIRRKQDVFQPRVEKGRFGKQVQFNPENLKQDLIKMAAGRGLNVATRQLLPPQARVAVEAGLMVDDFLRSVTGKGLSDIYNEAKERFTESDDYYAVP